MFPSKRHLKRLIKNKQKEYCGRLEVKSGATEKQRPQENEEEPIEEVHVQEMENETFSRQKPPLKEKLRKWYIEHKPPRACVHDLLAILKDENCDVPLSLDTLVGKRKKAIIANIAHGVYCHALFDVSVLLQYNVDGTHGKKRLKDQSNLFSAMKGAFDCGDPEKEIREGIHKIKKQHFHTKCLQKKANI